MCDGGMHYVRVAFGVLAVLYVVAMTLDGTARDGAEDDACAQPTACDRVPAASMRSGPVLSGRARPERGGALPEGDRASIPVQAAPWVAAARREDPWMDGMPSRSRRAKDVKADLARALDVIRWKPPARAGLPAGEAPWLADVRAEEVWQDGVP